VFVLISMSSVVAGLVALLLGSSVTAYRLLIGSVRRWPDIRDSSRWVQIQRSEHVVDWEEENA
jgi:hypothetical protein